MLSKQNIPKYHHHYLSSFIRKQESKAAIIYVKYLWHKSWGMTGRPMLREKAFVEEEEFMIIQESWYDFKRQKQKDEEYILFLE